MRLLKVSRSSLIRAMLGCLGLFLASYAVTEATADKEEVVELTSVDLFVSPNWQHSPISVEGFTLGITRAQAFEIAKTRELTLRDNMPTRRVNEGKGPCHQQSCSVSTPNGNWIGVDLSFESDRVTKIKVSVPAEAYPEVKKVNIAREFKGLTRQFFNEYSDSLRTKVLGPAEGKETHDVLSSGPDYSYTHIEYDYLSSGIIVHVTVSKQSPKPFDLEVDFVGPN
jgi:hypothetical protein